MTNLENNKLKIFAKSDYVKAVLQQNYKNQEITYVKTPDECNIEIYEKNTLLVTGKEDDTLLRLKFNVKDEKYSKPAYFSEQDLEAFVHMLWKWECASTIQLCGTTELLSLTASGMMLDHIGHVIGMENEEADLMQFKAKLVKKEFTGEGIIVTNIENLERLNNYASLIQECYETVELNVFACATEEEEEFMETFIFEA